MKKNFTPRKNIFLKLIAFLMVQLIVCNYKVFAQSPPVLIFDTLIRAGLSSPVDIVNAGDGTGRLFIVEQTGTVKILSGGALLPGNFLDIPDSITGGGERGLLSIAFHPDYENNRYFYVYYNNTAGDVRLTRFQTQAGNPNAADESTGVVLLTIAKPFTNHNGCKLVFGPDGKLYFGTGDGGSGGDPNNFAQNGNSLLGKMIRLDVDNFLTPPYYTIPVDNPYVANPLVRDEVFAIGVRNPWRWSFDRFNGDMWIADVGQGVWEEVNAVPFATAGGINYGWRCYEGNSAYNTSGCLPQASYVSPIFQYPHNFASGGFAITGGYVYRGFEFPAMYGYYICSDYVSGNTWLIKPNGAGGWTSSIQTGLAGSISGFGEDELGALYAVGLNGFVYKVITNSVVLPVTLKQFTGKAFNGYNEIRWITAGELNMADYKIEYSNNGVNYDIAGSINPVNNSSENSYSFRHNMTPGSAKIFYRLKMTDINGRVTYSTVLVLDKKDNGSVNIYPNPLTGDQCTIISGKPIVQIILFTIEGSRIFTKQMNNISGTVNVPLPELQNGIYIMQLKTTGGWVNEKIMVQR